MRPFIQISTSLFLTLLALPLLAFYLPISAPEGLSRVETDSEYELVETMLQHTETQLKDLRALSAEISDFKHLEDQFSSDPDSSSLANQMIIQAYAINQIINRWELKEFFQPSFVDQISTFARMHPESQRINTLPQP